MDQPVLIYCYDAYCGWCYGFSSVMKKIYEEYHARLSFEVLSGGMIIGEHKYPIRYSAKYIAESYSRVEEITGIRFGEDYLWHIFHPEESDWFPDSEKPAIALCVLKHYLPDQQVAFASDLQYALHFEGRDLCDDEAYRGLIQKYGLPENEFYEKLHAASFKEEAYYEFALCKQLQVTGFPAILIQTSDSKFYQVMRGYTDYESLSRRIDNVLTEFQLTVAGKTE